MPIAFDPESPPAIASIDRSFKYVFRKADESVDA